MAGFFGLFDYSKPGKGVRKDEPKKSRFVHFFILLQRKFWKLVQLNLIFMLFCVPIVTIGPACAGMTYVLRNYVNERPVFLFSDFWDSFKLNFKQSFIYSILFAIISAVLFKAIEFYFLNVQQYSWMYIPLGLCFLVSLLVLMANLYIVLMIVTLELPLIPIIKNGFIFAIIGLKSNAVTMVILAVLLGISAWFFPLSILVFLFIGFALLGFIICYNAYPCIQKYAIDPYLASLEKEAEPVEEAGQVFEDEYPTPKKIDE